MTALLNRFISLENVVHRLLVRHSIAALRISVGAIVVIATMECFIGICFLIGSGVLMRMAIWVLAVQFVGILSPLVIAAGTFRGGKLVRDEPQPVHGT